MLLMTLSSNGAKEFSRIWYQMEHSSHATATSDQSTGNWQKPQWYTEGDGPGFISISPHTNNKVRHSESLGLQLPL